jgi:23S rRNA pseudouridine1911/1915/1917 synthase
MMTAPAEPTAWTVDPTMAGQRLDRFLADHISGFSRAHLQRAISAGGVTVNGQPSKASHKVHDGDVVAVGELEVPRDGPEPQPVPLVILYEDDAIAVIDKAAGMIVHPARGHWDGTMASGLAHHFAQLSGRGGTTRPGIVHRLDRDTSGVIVVAKNDQAHDALANQFQARTVTKEYLAIVSGRPDRDRDVIDQPIGDHPTHRERKAIRHDHPSSRAAVTFYEVEERFARFALVRARPKTGRTHQIRLHLTHVGMPVLCDRLYGGRSQVTADELGGSGDEVLLRRQALHAHRLSFTHPTSGAAVEFEAPLHDDLRRVLDVLRGS